MGGGAHGGFGGTKGSRTYFKGSTKQSALSSISKLPQQIQSSAKHFFKGGSNKYNHFSVERLDNGNFIMRMEKPGNVPGSKAIYYKVVDRNGILIRAYKETFDPKGNLVHTKEK